MSVVSLVALTSEDAFAAGSYVPTLGAASVYALLAGSVHTTGHSVVAGDVGVAPVATAGVALGLSSVTDLLGALTGDVAGDLNVANGASTTAHVAASAAYRAAASEAPTHAITGGVLAGVALTPGVYEVTGPLALRGLVTLNALGNKNANFIFQVPGDLTAAPHSALSLVGGASASHVLWQVGNTASLGSGSTFAGTILANHGINLGVGANLVGRALSLLGDVNLNASTISLPSAVTTPASTVEGVASGASSAVTTPSSLATSTPVTSPASGLVPSVSSVGPTLNQVVSGTAGALPSLASGGLVPSLTSAPASTVQNLVAGATKAVPALTGGLTPAVSSTAPTKGKSTLIKVSGTPGAATRGAKARTSHANSSNPSGTSTSASGTIPVGAPATGMGGMAGSGLTLWALLGVLAFAVAGSATSFASRTRRRHA